MSRYRKEIEIVFPVSREPSGWMHDTLDMPRCLAGWLDANGFSGAVEVRCDVVVHGRSTGYDSDDIHEFTFRGASVNGTPIPVTVVNCALSGEWEDHFSAELLDARQSACVAV